MTVVDASVVVEVLSGDARGQAIRDWMMEAIGADERLDAPTLIEHEVANTLVRLTFDGRLPSAGAFALWERFLTLPITYHALGADGPRAMEIAGSLRRRSVYDAAYLALAERLDCELVTLDGSLARNASTLGFRISLFE